MEVAEAQRYLEGRVKARYDRKQTAFTLTDAEAVGALLRELLRLQSQRRRLGGEIRFSG